MRKFIIWIFVVSLLSIILLLFSKKTFIESIIDNHKSLQLIELKDFTKAEAFALNAIMKQTQSAALHINLGLIYLLKQEFDKAQNEFQAAYDLSMDSEAPQRNEEQFDALFNKAITYALQKKISEALEAYQKALEIKPESVEVKTNIELLMQNSGGKGQGNSNQDSKNKDSKSQGSGESENDSGDQEKNKEKNQNAQRSNEMPKNLKQPYKGKEISKDQADKILDELKQQEQNVRARFENRRRHGATNEKDW